MSSFRQIEANRRNARLSTGPVTEEGKRRSRQNALRHGLTAETVIDALEDAEDYAAFEMAVTADYDAQSAVERELVLRLASLLWRLRRASAIESGLFKIQAKTPASVSPTSTGPSGASEDHRQQVPKRLRLGRGHSAGSRRAHERSRSSRTSWRRACRSRRRPHVLLCSPVQLATCPLDRLSRYEATLWRQACQILFTLQCLDRRKPWERRRLR